jgi:hypothetical protein
MAAPEQHEAPVTIKERVKNICLSPATEWPVIAGEPTSAGSLITSYVAPLAAIGAIAGFIGGSLVGQSSLFVGTFRIPIVTGVVLAAVSFVMAIVSVFIVSLVINALAPTFGAEKNSALAMKVAVYSYTPFWVAGALRILPSLGVLALLAGLYGFYVMYLGLPRLMKCPQDKAVGYTAVVIVSTIVITLVVGAVGGIIGGIGLVGGGALSGAGGGGLAGALSRATGGSGGTADEVQFDKDSALGKLQALGKSMDATTKKMDAAQKSGDADAQVGAAVEGLGALLGGGKHVDPVGIDVLKPFVPDTFAGLAKKSSSAEKNGLVGLAVSKAEASYGDESNKRATLEVADTGGVSGLVGLASWAGVQGEKDDDSTTERTEKVNGRLVHEKLSKVGGSNEFGIVLGDRFIVSATGYGIDLKTLESAVNGLDLAKLEAMKDVGVAK